MLNRRGLITGLISFVAAPAIVRVSSIMPVRQMLPPPWPLSMGDVLSLAIDVGDPHRIWYRKNGGEWYSGARDVPLHAPPSAFEWLGALESSNVSPR